jgi:hypothetical protein
MNDLADRFRAANQQIEDYLATTDPGPAADNAEDGRGQALVRTAMLISDLGPFLEQARHQPDDPMLRLEVARYMANLERLHRQCQGQIRALSTRRKRLWFEEQGWRARQQWHSEP